MSERSQHRDNIYFPCETSEKGHRHSDDGNPVIPHSHEDGISRIEHQHRGGDCYHWHKGGVRGEPR